MPDATAVHPTTGQSSDAPLHCPQFRALRGDRAYPISGYCALTAAPGALMIPSAEEFRTFCTTRAYPFCPWAEPHDTLPVPLLDRWACPTLRWSRMSS